MKGSMFFNELNTHLAKKNARFHMPAHGGNAPPLSLFGNILPYDLTELPSTGSLLEEKGAIVESEKKAAELFGVKATLYSAGGATLPIRSMIYLACRQGGKMIVGRNAHISAVNTMALFGITPVWVYPEKNGSPLFGRITAKTVENAIRQNEGVQAVFITSPDYYGTISDVRAISKVCEAHNIPLLVDSAHGSHIQFTDKRMDANSQGAAMSVYSAHKTLPVLTGGAFFHVNHEKYVKDARRAMKLFASTSPSYLTLLSLDLCVDWLKQNGRAEFSKLVKKTKQIETLALEQGFLVPGGKKDRTRITLITTGKGISGEELAAHFRSKGVEPEYADEWTVVLIPSPFNSEEDFEKLKNAISSAQGGPKCFKAERPIKPVKVLDMQAALKMQTEEVGITDCENRVCAESLTVCPPCIPLVLYGERLTKDIISRLKKYGILKVKVVI